MSGSSKGMGPISGKNPKRKDVAIDIATARQMLPLVRSIVSDIVTTRERLDQLGPEQERLERNRRSLDWSARDRRYSLKDEVVNVEKELAGAMSELNNLGVALVDAGSGQVAFPTRINGRPAAFSWQVGEDGLKYWHYAGEDLRRPIPQDWLGGTAVRTRGEP
ncbi:MAG: DUF2203 family protein [Gemmataceae bacterium]